MSDLMLLGILRMPESSIEGDALALMQFINAARGAADRIESDAKLVDKLRAALEAAAADKQDAERYRALRRGQHWSVVNGIGDVLRAVELDAAIDAVQVGDR